MGFSRPRLLSGAFVPAAICVLAVGSPSIGCGSSSRPPPLGDSVFTAGPNVAALADGGGGSLGGVTQTGPPMCSLGPNGGVCACVDEPLLTDPPNLYFVLDRSFSMNQDQKWETIIEVLGQLIIDLGPRGNVGAAVFPNPAGPTDCSPGVEVFAPHPGDSPAGQAGPTAITLLSILGHISAAGGTPTAVTLQDLAPRIQSLPGKTYVILATDGAPNCDPSATCDFSQCQPNIENASGCPPEGPSCCDPSVYGNTAPESCNDEAPTQAAVQAIAAGGVPVYVVGVPGSEPYAMLLDGLATAGGTARSTEPYYYAVSSTDQAAFTAALFKIAATVTASCTLTLDSLPPDPSAVNVFFDESPIAQPGPDGWTLNGQTVTILGQSCAEMQNGDVLDVRVVAGCPTVLR